MFLVSALSTKSIYHWLIDEIFNEKFDVFITEQILFEYEEILARKYSASAANNFIASLKLLPTVHYTHIYFYWRLLQDADARQLMYSRVHTHNFVYHITAVSTPG